MLGFEIDDYKQGSAHGYISSKVIIFLAIKHYNENCTFFFFLWLNVKKPMSEAAKLHNSEPVHSGGSDFFASYI